MLISAFDACGTLVNTTQNWQNIALGRAGVTQP